MSDRQLGVGTDVQRSSWVGHKNLGVISIKMVFDAAILNEIRKGCVWTGQRREPLRAAREAGGEPGKGTCWSGGRGRPPSGAAHTGRGELRAAEPSESMGSLRDRP